jgi:hypothetical protein
MSEQTITITSKGYRGTRLGGQYIYRWIDQEPTSETWADRVNGREGKFGCLGMILIVALSTVVWGEAGFFLSLLFGGPGLGMILGFVYAGWGRRGDDEPIPKPVPREAWIEFWDGGFFFVLEVNGEPEIFQPWELVRQFERVDYWPMFGGAGKNPYNTGWHAIVMTPATGRPWLIGSTIEAEANVRERFTELDKRFSAAAHANFMRVYEAEKKRHERKPDNDAANSIDGVPSKL